MECKISNIKFQFKQMKKIFFLAGIVCLSLAALAQAKIVKYFDKLPTENKHGYAITYKVGKYKVEADNYCAIVVDDKNGYLQITDDGTGGGTFVLELAIFKTAKGEDILAVNNYSYSGDGREEGAIKFFDVANKMAAMTMSVWPDIGYIEDLLHNGVNKADIAPFEKSEYIYCTLPRVGTTITMHLGYKTLDYACDQDKDKNACALKQKITPSKLVWNKKTSFFDLK
jgi:hypothetical protein